ncbi:LSM domain containing protein [Entamoeba histolytica HM-3:IMSS]|uniref:U6 snRNA-associated Sm-like protein LSm4 n=7 Tax=Entamoeba TaxID=5758 RepID=C4LUD9_ENTH1|nr:LSM domain containing protein [Entamoeba histolytica HM-1:IMSS]EAL50464.1 LSM domain containing protein [Entamoeba histolytica HM-1:IMSS]EMD44781.1 LSM domain containing protein [Entamoeba histolytica KU27]EMS10943.1 LSM domain containing protein [Entamoeba histolytica HM-3:IMSS]GAT92223.1 lsm domain containing protein [Entamoeba histolytica]|eukprot:XP_655862.1 LSM domain containing protein [Entamoeba histolytica HM-1:IMSS]
MVLPINLLENSQGTSVTLELKNGFKYTGILDRCDRMMNIHLKNAILIKPSGDRFSVSKLIVKGISIRCFSVDESLLKKNEK